MRSLENTMYIAVQLQLLLQRQTCFKISFLFLPNSVWRVEKNDVSFNYSVQRLDIRLSKNQELKVCSGLSEEEMILSKWRLKKLKHVCVLSVKLKWWPFIIDENKNSSKGSQEWQVHVWQKDRNC